LTAGGEVVGFTSFENLSGLGGNDTFNMDAAVDGTVDGGTNGGAGDVINGLATANAFDITSANGGTVNGTTFANVENLNGGADIDTFTFTGALSGRAFGDGDDDIFNVENGGSAGAIDGGADIDTVSYADPARIVGVTVAQALQTPSR